MKKVLRSTHFSAVAVFVNSQLGYSPFFSISFDISRTIRCFEEISIDRNFIFLHLPPPHHCA